MNFIGSGSLQDAGRMSAGVLPDEPWRAVTALTLHVDSEHMLGNAVMAAGCTLLLSRRTGLGVAVGVAVVGGAAGNALAGAYAPEAVWVGASTAVFALLGALCVAYRSVCMALLTVALCYGSHGPDVCTAAHIAGAVAGVAVGIVTDREHKFSALPQLACAAAAAGAVALSWAMALS